MNGFASIIREEMSDSYLVFQTGDQFEYENGCWISQLSGGWKDPVEAVVVCHGTAWGPMEFEHYLVAELEDIVKEVKRKIKRTEKIYIVCCFPGVVREYYQDHERSVPVEFVGNWRCKAYTQVMANGAYFQVTPENPKWIM